MKWPEIFLCQKMINEYIYKRDTQRRIGQQGGGKAGDFSQLREITEATQSNKCITVRVKIMLLTTLPKIKKGGKNILTQRQYHLQNQEA